jgi:hypothetical protein
LRFADDGVQGNLAVKIALRRHVGSLLLLCGAFAISRAGAYAAGVRFDATPVRTYYHFADPVLLQNDFVRTIWWLHMQPPLMNVLAGLGLRLPVAWQVPAYATLFAAATVLVMVGVYALSLMFGLPRWVGIGLAIIVGCSPPALVYENLLFYPALVTAGLVVTFVALFRYLRTGAAAWGLVSFAAGAALVLTRATYHPLWLAGLVVVAVLARPEIRRRTLVVAAVPLFLAAGLYVKNWVQVGSFTGSSWIGLNLADVPRSTVSQPDRLPGVLKVAPFTALEGREHLNPQPRTGIPILDQQTNSTSRPNYNNLAYVDLSRQYLRATLKFAKDNPGLYRQAVTNSLSYEFTPATSQPSAFQSKDHLHTYQRLFDVTIGGEPHEFAYFHPGTLLWATPTASEISWTLVVVYVLALALLPAVVWRAHRRPGGDRAARLVLAAAGATIWIGVVSGVLLETMENSRFRFETDPLAWVLAAVAVAAIVRRVIAWRRRRIGPQADDLVIDLRDRPSVVVEAPVATSAGGR